MEEFASFQQSIHSLPLMDYNKASLIAKGLRMKRWLYRWGPAILIMGLIFIASSASGSSIPDFGSMNLFVLKGGHLLGYALLGAAWLHGMSGGGSITRSRVAAAGILVILYAISDEWHQSFTPGRNPALRDICIDTAGGFLGMACLHWARKRFLHPVRET
jgi:hypothetical protein